MSKLVSVTVGVGAGLWLIYWFNRMFNQLYKSIYPTIYQNFCELPDDCIYICSTFMDLNSIKGLATSCKRFNKLLQDRAVSSSERVQTEYWCWKRSLKHAQIVASDKKLVNVDRLDSDEFFDKMLGFTTTRCLSQVAPIFKCHVTNAQRGKIQFGVFCHNINTNAAQPHHDVTVYATNNNMLIKNEFNLDNVSDVLRKYPLKPRIFFCTYSNFRFLGYNSPRNSRKTSYTFIPINGFISSTEFVYTIKSVFEENKLECTVETGLDVFTFPIVCDFENVKVFPMIVLRNGLRVQIL